MKATTNTVKRIDRKVVKQEHILSFDIDNQYPQRVIDIIADSSTGTRAVNTLQKFTMGGGFSDKDFYKSKINRKGMTVDTLLRKVSFDFARLNSFGLHINYNALFEIVEVSYIHVQNLRLTDPNDPDGFYRNKVAIYNDWGKVVKKKIELKDIDFLNFYDPNPEVIQKQVDAFTEYDKDGNVVVDGWSKYQGQVYWYGTIETMDYQLSLADSVLEDMQTQGRMKRFKLNSVGNNFMASHIFKTGKYEDESDRDAFNESLKEFQGDENTAGILHVELENPDDLFDIEKVDIQNYDGLYEYTETSVKESIYEPFQIPPVLVFSTPNKLGSGAEIEDATSFYNGITADFRLIFEEVFSDIFNRFYKVVNATGDYSIIPFKSPRANKSLTANEFKYMTIDEVRDYLGLPKMNDEEKSKLIQNG